MGNIKNFLAFGTKKGEISIIFVGKDGKEYKIRRFLPSGHRILYEYNFGNWSEKETRDAQINAIVKELLGIDPTRALDKEFEYVIGPFQGRFLYPFNESGKERTDSFEKILGISEFREAFKATQRHASLIKSKIEELTHRIADFGDIDGELDSKHREYQEVLNKINHDKKMLQQLRTEIDKLTQEVSELDQLKNSIHELELSIKHEEGNLKAINSELQKYRQDKMVITEARTQMEKLHPYYERYREIERSIEELNRSLQERDELTQKLTEYERQQVQLETEIKELTKKLDDLKKDIDLLNQEKQQLDGELSHKDEVEHSLTQLMQLQKRLEALKSAKVTLEERLRFTVEGEDKLRSGICPIFNEACPIADSVDLTAKKKQLHVEITKLKEEIEQLEPQVNRLDDLKLQLKKFDLLNERRDKLLAELHTKHDMLSQVEQRIDELQLKLNLINKERNELANKLSEFDKLQKRLHEITEESEKLKPSFEEYMKLTKFVDRESEVNAHIGELEHQLSEVKARIEAYTEQLEAMKRRYDEVKHSEKRTQLERLKADHKAYERELEIYESNLRSLEADIINLESKKTKLEQLKSERDEWHHTLELLQFIRDRIFNKIGERLSQKLRTRISIEANRIYQAISDTDEELEWGEGYSIRLVDYVNGVRRVREDMNLSGGEFMTAVIALRLALLKVCGTRIAFFDEPTSNLDTEHRENLVEVFKRLEEGGDKPYDQLFLISHDVSFTEITDNRVELAKDPIRGTYVKR